MAKRLRNPLITYLVVALGIIAAFSAIPLLAGADYPVPQGPAASCDGGTSPVCGYYAQRLRLNLASKVDGGILPGLPLNDLAHCDAGESPKMVADAWTCAVASGGGGSVTGVDGGGIVFDGSAGYVSPLCDGGVLSRPAGGGPWFCSPLSELTPAPSTGAGRNVLTLNPGGTASLWGQALLSSSNAVTGTLGLVNGGTGLSTASGLTTGNVVEATSGTTIGYGTVNLGSANAVSGTLPIASFDQTGSAYNVAQMNSGGTAASWGPVQLAQSNAVTGLLGTANGGTGLNSSTGLTTGNGLRATSATTIGYAATNLAGGSGYVTGNLPVANGGLGTAPSCVAGDLLMSSSPSAIGCIVSSGDVSYASSGAATVTSLQAGEIVVGGSTGTLTAAATATAPGLAQASESTTQTPTMMAISPQASTHSTNQDSSGLDIDLSAPLGTGLDAYTCQYRNGAAQICMGAYPGGVGEGIWFGTDRGSISTLNHSFLQYASSVYLNAQSGGTLYFEIGGGAGIVEQLTTASAGFAQNVTFGTVGGGTSGGGTNEAIWTNGTAPTSACTGGTCLGSVASTGLVATSAAFDVDTIQPVTSGTHNTQILKNPKYSCQGSSTTSASVVCTMAVPQGGMCGMDLWIQVRCTSTAGVCTTGNSTEQRTTGVAIKNLAGTAALLAGSPGTWTTGDTTTGLSCTTSVSGGNFILTCGDLANAATADWTIKTSMYCD